MTQIPSKTSLTEWVNMGGQLVLKTALEKLVSNIASGKLKNWEDVHSFYKQQAEQYPLDKLKHSLASLKEVNGPNLKGNLSALKTLLQQSVYTKEWMVKGIHDSRAKDYTNPFRKMVYETAEEMNAVVGKLESNSFIRQELSELNKYKKKIQSLLK